MALQVFRTDQHPFEITTMTVDQVVWFKGCEAAACLNYARPRNAVKDLVDEEDKKTYAKLIEGRIDTAPPFISNRTRSTSTSPAFTVLSCAPKKRKPGSSSAG